MFAACVGVIVLASFAIRVPTLTAGLPYPAYIDEIFTLRPAASMIADRTWEPRAYNYPPFLMYATVAAGAVLHALPGGGSVGAGARASLEQPTDANILSTDLIVAGRLVVLLSATATVLVSALLARRLGGRRAGVVAALLTMVLPALVTRSAWVIVDTPATFFATSSVLCASYLRSGRQTWLWAVLAGVTAGLATATKYPAGIAILVVLTVILLWSERSLRERLALSSASITAAAISAVVAAPTLLLRTNAVVNSVRKLNAQYRTSETTTYWHELLKAEEVGALMVVAGGIGFLALLRSARTRPLTIGCAVFTVAYVAPLVRYSFQPLRNVLPLLPLLCVVAAVGIVASIDTLSRFAHVSRWPRAFLSVAIGVAVCSVSVSAARRDYIDRVVEVVNTRIETRQWLVRHASVDDDILVASELAFLPSELDRIPATVTVAPLTAPLTPAQAKCFDYVVVSNVASESRWRSALVDRRPVVRYGTSNIMRPYYVHPRLVVRVFATSTTGDPRTGAQDHTECSTG